MSSNSYWRRREEEALRHYIKQEAKYEKEIQRIYQDQLDAIQKEIDAFYGRYAKAENITIAEAKKRVSKADIAALERKATKYVKDKDLSARANEEMRLYNATMRINRLEMLKADIGRETVAGHDELDRFMAEILKGRTEEELKRQAGILGRTIKNNARLARTIPNASFHNATFSDRIWMNQALLKAELAKLLQTGLIQGKNPRVLARDLKKIFNVSTYNAERLMRTELARVQTEAQKQSFQHNGFEKYEFIANSNCCDICQGLDGKHFKVKDMTPGKNAPPMHPNCVLPGTKIIAPDMEAMTRSEYSGDIVEIGTANGTRLSVTANHIVLTARGWVRAKNIVEGDKVISYSGWGKPVVESNPTDDNGIPTVEQLFAAFVKASAMPPFRVPVAAEDFKGDVVPDSEVDVIFINGELRNKIDSSMSKFVSDILLIGTTESGESKLPVKCSLAKLLVGFGLASDGIMSGKGVAGVLFRGAFTHHELVCFRRSSDYDSRLFKTAIDNGTTNPELFGNGVLADTGIVQFNNFADGEVDLNAFELNTASSETPLDGTVSNAVNISYLLNAFSGFVSFDDVIFVSNKFYSGHVYDASCSSTLYICNGILSSNCRCSISAYEDDAEYEAWLDFLDKGGTTEEEK